ncbi:HAD-superfamily hydrolase [Xylona heveae TC161]|uniref:HAD-superfamily hydrolase n=1 Tax=Xylona heveae (strain CBS 132557 / TC161) TaxID=1328760 RepID=A0A165GQL5_XYLHT|nr:HAD-superfamily hydrolase [Xylona heveae TC161]KZF22474.1 HAD-superfamily hydrolase [Xylona heveae TC161]
MAATARNVNQTARKSLLLAFDAFGTLFTPKEPVPKQYGEVARKYGVSVTDDEIQQSFRLAFKDEAARNPNYGKAVGMNAQTWWANVIRATLKPKLEERQALPAGLIPELINRFSSSEGYMLYPDVLPLFQEIRNKRDGKPSAWPWERTIVGIITNSDDRVPDVLSNFGLKVGARAVGRKGQKIGEIEKDDDIEFVVLSYDVGAEKPDRRIFEAAKDMLVETLIEERQDSDHFQAHGKPGTTTDKYNQAFEATRNLFNGQSKDAITNNLGASDLAGQLASEVSEFELLYVGDELKKDVLGAQNAGWPSLLLDREHKYRDSFSSGAKIASVIESSNSDTATPRKFHVIQDLRNLSSVQISDLD